MTTAENRITALEAAVEALAALRRAWVVVTDTDTGPAGDGSLTAWHDQWPWPCLNRVKAGHDTISGCRQHHEPGRAHLPSPTGSSSDPDHRQHIGEAPLRV